MDTLTVFINEQPVYEHDKTTELTDAQVEFLDRMDHDMGRGVKIHGELISEPNIQQRANFVAMNLIRALLQEDNAKIIASCTYLGNRLPKITEVHARDQDGRVSIELIEQSLN